MDQRRAIDVIARYNAGERDFQSSDLADRVHGFENCDLRGALFTGSFILASFRNADLEGADFSNCNVKSCDFSDARLVRTNFRGASIDGADFTNADIQGADFEGATAYGYSLAEGELPPHSDPI